MRTPPKPEDHGTYGWQDLDGMSEIRRHDYLHIRTRYRWDAMVGETHITFTDNEVLGDIDRYGIDHVRELIRSEFERIERQLQGKSNDNTAAEMALSEVD